MLYDHHRVALVTQGLEGCYEFAVVPLVKPDARFVEDVEHIDKFGTNLGRKPDSLAFTSGKRRCCPVE